MSSRFLWIGVLLFLGVGCVHRPAVRSTLQQELSIPSHWQAAPAKGKKEEKIPLEWWEELGCPGLTEAVAEALRQNHDLKQAWARVEQAMAQARIAGAALYPSLNAAGNVARQQRVFVGLPIPGQERTVLKSLSTSYSINFTLGWELDLWGRIRAARKAALSELAAQTAQWRAAWLSLAAQAAKAWVNAVEARRQWELSRQIVHIWRLLEQDTVARYAQGLTNEVALRLVRQQRKAAEAEMAQRQATYEAAVRQLEVLLGRYPSGEYSVPETLPKLTNSVPAGLPSELLRRRPDILAAEEQARAALYRVREAKAALWPSIQLTGSGGRASGYLEDLVESRVTIWTLAANLTQPIFQGGRLRANVRLNQARAKAALEHYMQTVLNAFREVETALRAEQTLRQQEQALEAAVAEARATMRVAQERYARGIGSFRTAAEAQRTYETLESQLVAIRRARLLNRINLYLALGGGFEEPNLSVPPELRTAKK